MIPITEDEPEVRAARGRLHLHALPDTITEDELLSLYERWQDARAVYMGLPNPNKLPTLQERFQADLVEREAFRVAVAASTAYHTAADKFAAQKRSVA